MKVAIQLLNDNAKTPQYATEGAAGMDLHACERMFIFPGETLIVPTGISLEIPTGYEGQIRSRSGLAAKEGVAVLNAPGTIDSDYRGEIKVILHNHSNKVKLIDIGERIAQIVFAKHEKATFDTEAKRTYTRRGTGGIGSTGK